MIELKRKSQKPAESAEMPLKGAEAQKAGEHLPDNKPALKGQQTPFRSIDGKRDYRAMYAALYKFHAEYNPPEDSAEYWKAAQAAAAKLSEQYKDEYLNSLLIAAWNELVKEYQTQYGDERFYDYVCPPIPVDDETGAIRDFRSVYRNYIKQDIGNPNSVYNRGEGAEMRQMAWGFSIAYLADRYKTKLSRGLARALIEIRNEDYKQWQNNEPEGEQ